MSARRPKRYTLCLAVSLWTACCVAPLHAQGDNTQQQIKSIEANQNELKRLQKILEKSPVETGDVKVPPPLAPIPEVKETVPPATAESGVERLQRNQRNLATQKLGDQIIILDQP